MVKSDKPDKDSKKIIKKRRGGIAGYFSRSLSIFMLLFLIISVTIGLIYVRFRTDKETENDLVEDTIDVLNAATAFLFDSVNTNVMAIIKHADEIKLQKGIDEYLTGQAEARGYDEVYLISPDGKIRYSN